MNDQRLLDDTCGGCGGLMSQKIGLFVEQASYGVAGIGGGSLEI